MSLLKKTSNRNPFSLVLYIEKNTIVFQTFEMATANRAFGRFLSCNEFNYFRHLSLSPSTYPLTGGVVGAPQMTSQPVFSISSVLSCSLGLGELQACPFLEVVFPPLFLFALSSSPFRCALHDGLGQTWRTGGMSIPLQFASFYRHFSVRRRGGKSIIPMMSIKSMYSDENNSAPLPPQKKKKKERKRKPYS